MSNKNNPKFTINNFRIFDKPHTFELAPITILTGPNNSGKSSLVKALLMLKNERNTEEIPFQINLPNPSLDLPKASELLTNEDEYLGIKFDTLIHESKVLVHLTFRKNSSNLFLNSIKITNYGKDVFYSSWEDEFSILTTTTTFDFKFWLDWLRSGYSLRKMNYPKHSFEENPEEWFNVFEHNLSLSKKKHMNSQLFDLEYEDENLSEIPLDIINKFNVLQNQLLDNLSTLNETNLSASDLYLFALKLTKVKNQHNQHNFFDSNSFETQLRIKFEEISLYFTIELKKQIKLNLPGNFKLKKTELYSDFESLYADIISQLGSELSEFTNIDSLPINKSLGKRYFLSDNPNLSLLEETAIKLDQCEDTDKEFIFTKWIDYWLIRFGIGKRLRIDNIDGKGIYCIEIIDFNDKSRNLRDLGYGVSQIVTLLLAPFNTNFILDEYTRILATEQQTDLVVDGYPNDKAPTFYLEEPESNLHPNWQSLLMELITEINQKFGIRFIIETHSEYMIRKLQYLMADKTKNLDVDNAWIYYFNADKFVDESKGVPKIKKIKIDKNGGLSDNFGPGFYDEAINLEFDLLKLRNYQKN